MCPGGDRHGDTVRPRGAVLPGYRRLPRRYRALRDERARRARAGTGRGPRGADRAARRGARGAGGTRAVPRHDPRRPTRHFDAPTLPLVREFVAVYADRAGLPRRRLGDLQLAVNELATNAVVHGGGTGQVRIWPAGRQLVCEVRDRGTASGRLAGLVPPAPESLGGRGLVLVNYLSDLVRVHTGPDGTAVRVHLDL